jgi:hypothetical protein
MMLKTSCLALLSVVLAVTASESQTVAQRDSTTFKIALDTSAASNRVAGRNLTATVRSRGGPKQTPTLELTAWNGECTFSLDLSTSQHPLTNARVEQRRSLGWTGVSVVSSGITHRVFTAPSGGVEWEIVLASMPGTNTLRFDIETNDLKFFYQDTLTDAEKRDGDCRPDSVVGSWAVYHARAKGDYHRTTGASAYGTGKAFHIFRPRAWDSRGDTVWCDLDIDARTGSLTVNVPAGFLNGAKYPVTIDPHFGQDQIGASATNFTNAYNYALAYADDQYSASAGDRVDSLVMYFVYSADSAALAVYAVDAEGKPTGSPVGAGSRVGSSASGQWVAAPVNINLTAGVSYTVVEAENMADGTRVAYDSYTNCCSRCSGSAFCDPWSEMNVRPYRFSAYAVYTNSSAAAPPTGRRRHEIIGGLTQ